MVDDVPDAVLKDQCLTEVQDRNGQPEQREDDPRGSAEVQVSLGWLQDEVDGRRE